MQRQLGIVGKGIPSPREDWWAKQTDGDKKKRGYKLEPRVGREVPEHGASGHGEDKKLWL